MGYKYVLFDLDGTLTDSEEGITNSVKYALEDQGIVETDRSALIRFIGPPLYDSFTTFYGMTHDNAERAIEKFRERFVEGGGMFENKVYEGVIDLLKKLTDNGHKLAVATSKPEPFARMILDRFQLTSFFDLIVGTENDGPQGEKKVVIESVIRHWDDTEKNKMVMIGDRKYDIIGANENGIDSIGVLYGFSEGDELKMAGATYIAATAEDVFQVVTT